MLTAASFILRRVSSSPSQLLLHQRLPLSTLTTRTIAAPLIPTRHFQTNITNKMTVTYPTIRRDETVKDVLHGVTVQDPYRWLEDPDSEETKAFVEEQNKLSSSIIEAFPHREKFRQALTKMFDYERYGCPFKEGDAYYYFHNSGLQPQSVMYKQSSLDAKPQVFLDPNTLSADGTVALSNYSFSESGKLFAYSLSSSGSDWLTIHVRSTEDGAPMDMEKEPIEWAKFTGITWTHDEKGFFYLRYPKPASVEKDSAGTETDQNTNAMLYYHKLNTPQSSDILIHQDPENPNHIFSAEVSDDGKYLMITTSESCDPKNKVFIADLEKVNAGKGGEGLSAVPEFVKVVDEFKAEFSYITNEGPVFYFKTSLNAPRYKIAKYDLNNASQGFVDIIPQHAQNVLKSVLCVDHNKIVAVYLQDVKHALKLFALATGEPSSHTLPLPTGSIVDSITGKKKDSQIFYKFSSFLNPGLIYQYDFKDMKHVVFKETKVNGLDGVTDKVVVEQVFFESKDGTRVPMYIVHRKDVELDGDNTTLLYGYGGFNISVLPYFSPTWMTFVLHMKGVLCIANIRGGGEYGESWYHGGRLQQKQNVFDDFKYAAKWLIKHRYTKASKLGINGGSNGGLLVGACVNQAPELFGCAIADVGVMDMLRFHKFTIGHAWISDYGNPDVKEDFEVLHKYSPVHTVHAETAYPYVLLTTSDHDDRVVPLHSYKYIAHLQHGAHKDSKPLVIRIETKAGHGAGKPTKKRIDEATDKFSFLGLALDAKWVEDL